MRAVKTVETIGEIGPPPEVTDGSIGSLPYTIEGDYIFSVWVPTEGERKAIANGYNVRLGMGYVGIIPPVSLSITHLQAKEEQL